MYVWCKCMYITNLVVSLNEPLPLLALSTNYLHELLLFRDGLRVERDRLGGRPLTRSVETR